MSKKQCILKYMPISDDSLNSKLKKAVEYADEYLMLIKASLI